MDDQPSGHMPDDFDLLFSQLRDLPDVVTTKASLVRAMPFMGVGGSILYVVTTMRQQHEGGASKDVIFLERVGQNGEKTIRLPLPPDVADAIARQRDSLGTKVRKKSARRVAAERKLRGEKPGFLLTAAERKERKKLREAKKKESK